MTFRPLRTALALGLLSLALSPQTSFAEGDLARNYPQRAKPTADIRLRAGPGANFAQVDVVRRGETLTVRSCRGDWCQINQQDGGPSGFMSSAYLVFLGEIRG